jgi:hypothetical protein
MSSFDKLLGIEPQLDAEKRERAPSPNASLYRRKYLRAKKRNPISLLFKNAKRRAREKGLEFSITKDDVPMPKVCPILGIPLFSAEGYAKDNSPSIDRIDSTKGYVPGNVMIISFRANTLKNDATRDELQRVLDFLCKTT